MKKYTSKQLSEFVSGPQFDAETVPEKDGSLPRITIVTLSYDQGKYLEQAILSVLNQGYPNLEYIIIDGGSTDGSVDIIRKYEKYLSYWITEKDNGQSEALNKGFEQATGKIYAYLNSDDILFPGVLDKISNEFIRNKDTDVLYGNKSLISPEGAIISERRMTRWITGISEAGFFSRKGYWVYMDAAFWRRDAHVKTAGFDASLHNTMDVDLFLQLIEQKARFRFLREYFIGFRVHGQSKTEQFGDMINPAETKKLFEKYYPYKEPMSPARVLLLRLFRVFLYILQGDGLYLLRLYKEKRRKVNR
ncbi:glycosyltransferase family 2 protein [Candidatus Auribacterota bacterium]